MTINKITGIQIHYDKLPHDYNVSMHPETMQYRRALARASNAIEGVVLTDNDKVFMDSIPMGMAKDEFTKAVLNHMQANKAE